MLAIIATVGWIVFDVAISLATISDTMMPAWEWWVFLCGGVSLGLIALAGEILNHHSHAKEIGEILAGQESHLKEHDVLAKGNIAMLERLAAVTQTTGQSDSTVIEAATAKLAQREHKIGRYESIFWSPLTLDQKRRLT